MNNLYHRILFTWIIVISNLAGIHAFAENISLSDSLITDDYVYEYTFSDFDKAQQIMEKLRERKLFHHIVWILWKETYTLIQASTTKP